MKTIPITLAKTAHWHALLGRAEYLVQQCLPAEVADYLVRLFLNVETDAANQRSLLLTNDTNSVTSANKMQRLGDKCLLLCGFYPEIAEDFDVELEEFIGMGRDAYRSYSNHAELENAEIFSYLATNFELLADVLNRIQQLSCSNIEARAESGADLHATARRSPGPQLSRQLPVSRSIN